MAGQHLSTCPCGPALTSPPCRPLPACPADAPGKFDEVVEEHGVKIVIDAKALMHVLGTRMDYVEDRLR